jgi:hypothetical protein
LTLNKKARPFVAILCFFLGTGLAQTPPKEGKQAARPTFSYDSGGRRDPFKDLFGGKEVRERRFITGLSDLLIEEVHLMGIVKAKEKLEAIISLIEGFPLTIREGDQLADGYVLSIEETQVIFRKTKERGIPLAKPKDIFKEIIGEGH